MGGRAVVRLRFIGLYFMGKVLPAALRLLQAMTPTTGGRQSTLLALSTPVSRRHHNFWDRLHLTTLLENV